MKHNTTFLAKLTLKDRAAKVQTLQSNVVMSREAFLQNTSVPQLGKKKTTLLDTQV